MTHISTWDKITLPQLRLIEDAAIAAKTRAQWIVDGLGNLPARPDYPTLALDAMKRAEVDLKAAHIMLGIAILQYEKIPAAADDFAEAAE